MPSSACKKKRVVACIVLAFLTRCTTPSSNRAPMFPHLDECPNPTRESMGWRLIQGTVIEITGPRTFRLRTDSNVIVRVSLANVGEPVDPEAVTFLQRLI